MRDNRLFCILINVLLSFMAPEHAMSEDGFREVVFKTADAGRIHANLYGDGQHGVVLAHGAVFDKESWHDLATELAKQGYRAMAIDFRGYGESRPGTNTRALYLDVLAAVDYLRKNGAKQVSVLGGSMGGRAAATASTKAKEGRIDRLILLAPPPIESPERVSGKKLFVVSRKDRLFRQVEQQYKSSTAPKKLAILDGDAHAQHIFKTEHAEELTKLILDWLEH